MKPKPIKINNQLYEKVKGKNCQVCDFSKTLCFKIPETSGCIAENVVFKKLK